MQVAVILAVASLLLTAAAMLSRKKPKLANHDDALESQATVGAYIPLVIGRGRVGPVILTTEPIGTDDFAGGIDNPGSGQFGKGVGGAPNPPSFHEKGIHGLCVGPGSRLDAIFQNGTKIWQGPITPQSHPSGSQLTIIHESITEGTFQIFWGFPDDPTLLVAGINTRMSHAMKVYWVDKNLGQSRQWPRLEYEVSCPCYSEIANSAADVPLEGNDQETNTNPPTVAGAISFELAGYPVSGNYVGSDREEFCVFGFNAVERALLVVDLFKFGPSSTSGAQQAPQLDDYIYPGTIVKVRTTNSAVPASANSRAPGNGFPDALTHLPNNTWKYYWVVSTSFVTAPSSPLLLLGKDPDDFGTTNPRYGLNFLKVVLGAEVNPEFLKNISNGAPRNPNGSASEQLNPGAGLISGTFKGIGTIQVLNTLNKDGVNPIHIVDQLLFAKFPYGSGRNRFLMDSNSIEYCAQVIEKEKIRGGLVVREGEGAESSLSAIMQDLALMVPWDPEVGRYLFRLIRHEVASVDLPQDVVINAPEMESVQGHRPIDVVAFTFNDRTRNYREVPLKTIDSGQIAETEVQRAQKVRVEVTQDRDSMNRLLPRRQQEALANQAVFKWSTNHATRLAIPGSRFTAEAVEGEGLQFLITEVQRDINSSKNELGTLLDVYNNPPPALDDVIPEGMTMPEVETLAPLAQVEAFAAFEMPKQLIRGSGKDIEVLFLSSRGDKQTIAAAAWASKDGVSFSAIGYTVIAAKGVLSEDLLAGLVYDSAAEIDFGAPEISDFDLVEDLSGDENSWRAGRQILIIGNEVIFLREAAIDAVSPLVEGRLRGMVRGRAGTFMQTHLSGTEFWILLTQRAVPIISSAFSTTHDLHYKAQAVSVRGAVNVGEQTHQTLALTGKAFKPMDPLAVRQSNLRPTYASGAAAVDIVWAHSSGAFPRTSLGSQPFGTVVTGSPAQGVFQIEILDDDDIVIHSTVSLVPSYSVALSLRTTLALDAMPSWTFRVRHVEGAFASGFTPLTLSAV